MQFKPPLVFTVHGIRTHGHWQKEAADVLSNSKIPVASFDYGRFTLLSLLLRRKHLIDEFYKFAFSRIERSKSVDLADPRKRPSIISHSLGTYIVANCLQKHRDLKIDKLILIGSVLPCDFDWQALIARDQIGRVWNQLGESDWVPIVAERFLTDAGASGRRGFMFFSSLFHEEPGTRFDHSDGLIGQYVRNMLVPFLCRKPYGCTVIDGSQIEKRAQAERIFEQTGALDDEVSGLTAHYSEARIPDGLAEEWIEANPDIYSFLISWSGKVEGYLNAMPMDDQTFQRLLESDPIMDIQIRGDWLAPYTSNQELNLYILSIVTSPLSSLPVMGLYSSGVERLIVGFIDKLIRLWKQRRIRIKRMLAVGWTIKGERLCSALGLSRLYKDRFDHWVYFLDVDAAVKEFSNRKPPKSHHAIRRLISAYASIDK